MGRTAIGAAIGVVFVATVIWAALDHGSVQCEICVDYKGRSACSIAAAADLLQAETQAQSGACAQVTGGVTETLECGAIRPTVRRCSG